MPKETPIAHSEASQSNLAQKSSSLLKQKPLKFSKIQLFKKKGNFSIILIIVALIFPPCFLGQIITPLNNSYDLCGNTGVTIIPPSPTITQLAVGTLDPNWYVSTYNGGYTKALIINPPGCGTSGNQTVGPWNKWITLPSFTTCGAPGMYSCVGLTDLYFRRQFTLPANPSLMVDWSVWASDWVQDISVNGVTAPNSALAYYRGVVTSPYLNDRFNGPKFKWCTWQAGVNTVVIHIKMNPLMAPACKFAGIKVESWGTTAVYGSISGNTLVCANTNNCYTYTGGGSGSLFQWFTPGGWGGGSSSNVLCTTSSSNSGIIQTNRYTNSVPYTGKVCNATSSFSVTVSPQPTVTPSSTVVCVGNCVILTASGAATYTWQAPGLGTISNATAVTVCPTVNTVYTLKATSSFGCFSTKNIPITVLASPVVGISSSTTSVCAGRSAVIQGTGSATSYTWFSPASSSTTFNPLTVTPGSTSTYTVRGRWANGCMRSSTVSINVKQNPVVSASTNSFVICAGNSSTLTGSGANTYTWTPGSSSSNPFVVSPGSTTTYTATGTATNGCIGMASVQIFVLPSPTIIAVPQIICPGIQNTLTATGALTYTWYINGVQTYTSSNPSTIVVTATAGVTYSVCGSGPNGCRSCTSIILSNGAPIGLKPVDATLCVNAGPCANISVSSSLGSLVNYTWSTTPPTIGANAVVCPTANTIYTVNATSSFGCPSFTTVAVNIISSCCSQSTAGLVPLGNISGNLSNASFFLDGPINVNGLSQLKDVEIWCTPNARIDILPGSVLDLDHTHMFGCGVGMWKGIVVQDGGRITTLYKNTERQNSIIEDALVGIDLDNISTATEANAIAGYPPIQIQRIIFNRNFIGIKISNSDPALSYLPLQIIGCIFSSRNLPYLTGVPSSSLAWQSAEIQPGSPFNNNPGLRVVANPTTGLLPPYDFVTAVPSAFQLNLKQPYNSQPGHIGIKIENIGDPNSYIPILGVEIGVYTISAAPGSSLSIYNDFNLFDGLGNGVDVTDASLTLGTNVFQNMQPYNYPAGQSTLFGGNGIESRVTGLMNTQLHLTAIPFSAYLVQSQMFGFTPTDLMSNQFWNCVTGVRANNVYDFKARRCIFRSDHSTSGFGLPNAPGETGIYYESNRFDFWVDSTEFNNLGTGISFNTPVNPTGYDMNGLGSQSGVYANNFNIDFNYFGPQPLSTTAYSNGEYMSDAIVVNTPNTNPWTYNVLTSAISSNRIDRTYRGIAINSMENTPLVVAGNSIYIEDDYLGFTATPNFGYGISVTNNTGALSIKSNTLEGMGSAPPNNVSLMFFNNNFTTNAPSPYVFCNHVKNSNYGFQFDAMNPSTDWEGNEMCNNYAGLVLSNSAVIGPQGTIGSPCDNYWNTNCSSWGFGITPFQTFCDNSDPSLSPLFICTTAFPLTSADYDPIYNGFFPGGNPFYTPGTSIFYTTPHNSVNTDCYITTYPPVPSWRTAGQGSLTLVGSSSLDETSTTVFPNPTDGKLTIVWSEKKDPLSVKIVDLAGKTVFFDPSLRADNNVIDINSLPSSMYIIELRNQDQKVIRKKLIKTN